MLTIEDCIGLCELTEAEIDAIAEHKHIPEILAAELSQYLLRTPDGVPRIHAMIADDIDAAQARHDHKHAAQLKLALRHFIDTHERGAYKGAAGSRTANAS